MSDFHISVMSTETIKFLTLRLRKGGIFVDGTLGGGGHLKALILKCQKSKIKCQIIGIDLDAEAISSAKKNLAKYRDQVIYFNDNFANIKNILAKLKIKKIEGAVLDLGVSTHQLANPDRGFSFNLTADLDMRMNQCQELDAGQIINSWPENDLRQIFTKLGESPFAGRIARAVVITRQKKLIKTSNQLIEVIRRATPPRWRHSRQRHFATNIFRALRMEVNAELENLERAIPDLVEVLKPGGRLVIISFHSLEDRIVKNTFRRLANPCICPPKIPQCVCGQKPQITILTKKPVLPNPQEILKNPKSRSAKLRVAEKL